MSRAGLITALAAETGRGPKCIIICRPTPEFVCGRRTKSFRSLFFTIIARDYFHVNENFFGKCPDRVNKVRAQSGDKTRTRQFADDQLRWSNKAIEINRRGAHVEAYGYKGRRNKMFEIKTNQENKP